MTMFGIACLGIFTGSVYNDRTLIDALPGEYNCDRNVSVIKVHPHTHSFSELNSGIIHSDNDKCAKNGITKFERAVMLIRNPYDSIWSEYQRRLTQSHVQVCAVDNPYTSVSHLS